MAFGFLEPIGELIFSSRSGAGGWSLSEFLPSLIKLFLMSFGAASVLILLVLPRQVVGTSMYLILAVALIIGCCAGTFCSGAAVYDNPEGIYKDLETGTLNIPNLFPYSIPGFVSFSFLLPFLV